MSDLQKLIAAKKKRDDAAAPKVAAATAAAQRESRIRQAFKKLYAGLPSVDRTEEAAKEWIAGFVDRLQELVQVADDKFWEDTRRMVPRGERKEAEAAALAILLESRRTKPKDLAKHCLQLTLPGSDMRWQWEWALYITNNDTFLNRLFAGDLEDFGKTEDGGIPQYDRTNPMTFAAAARQLGYSQKKSDADAGRKQVARQVKAGKLLAVRTSKVSRKYWFSKKQLGID